MALTRAGFYRQLSDAGLRINRQNALRLSHRSRIRLGSASGRSPDLRFVDL